MPWWGLANGVVNCSRLELAARRHMGSTTVANSPACNLAVKVAEHVRVVFGALCQYKFDVEGMSTSKSKKSGAFR